MLCFNGSTYEVKFRLVMFFNWLQSLAFVHHGQILCLENLKFGKVADLSTGQVTFSHLVMSKMTPFSVA